MYMENQAFGAALILKFSHFLGGRFNHVTTSSTSNELGEYLFHSFIFLYFTFFQLNIGDNVQLKCKGRVNEDSLEITIAFDFCLFQ